MRSKLSAWFCILILAWMYGCAAKTPQEKLIKDPIRRVATELDTIFADDGFSNAFWGVMVQSMSNGEVLYQKNAEKLFLPASNMKLVTAAAVLHSLPADFHFVTSVQTDGVVEGGRLNGNLIVIGRGDPTISGRFYQGNNLRVFRDWAARLQEMGIRSIEGDIIGVDDYFDDIRWGSGWSWDDLGYPSAPEISALQFNEDLFTLVIEPGVIKSMDPETSFVQVVNSVQFAPAKTPKKVIWRREGNVIYADGQIPAGETDYGTFAVANPAAYFVHVFREVLEKNNIRVNGQTYRARDRHFQTPANLTLLISHSSPSLGEIVSVMLKESQNLYAETLLKTLGAALLSNGSFEGGKQAITDYLTSTGIASDSYILADGSGLSRYNYLTPQLLVRLLRNVSGAPYYAQFYNSLPVAGNDGTLKTRMKGTRAEGNARAKTGAIQNVRSLAGYIQTLDGEILAFALVANNFNVPRESAEYIQDLALERLANFTRKK